MNNPNIFLVRFSDILDYKEVTQLALKEAKKTDENIHSLILDKYKRKSYYQENFKTP